MAHLQVFVEYVFDVVLPKDIPFDVSVLESRVEVLDRKIVVVVHHISELIPFLERPTAIAFT